MTVITAREARLISELANAANEWNCTPIEALLEILYTFYEAAGFESERLAAEFEPMSDDELMDAYLNI
jgi:hypothetical protein